MCIRLLSTGSCEVWHDLEAHAGARNETRGSEDRHDVVVAGLVRSQSGEFRSYVIARRSGSWDVGDPIAAAATLGTRPGEA